MLWLYIHSINQQQQTQRFQCLLNHFETALSTLSLIAAAGNVLLEVYVVEEGHRTNLPPRAFDGQDMARPIRALQVEWEALLNRPARRRLPQNHRQQLELMLERIDQVETLMAEHDSSIAKLKALLDQPEAQPSDSLKGNRLLLQYQAIINWHYRSIEQALARRDTLLQKLTRLKRGSLN